MTPQFRAGLIGLAAGFIAALPGGPVNATLLGEAARKGFRWVIFVAVGATVMEAAYCAAALAGFARLFGDRWIRTVLELVSFGLMLWLGLKYLRGRPLPGEAVGERFVEEHFHPHTAFWTGFLRVLGNPGVLLLWLTVSTPLFGSGWVKPEWNCKGPFIAGVAAGGLSWFLMLGGSVSLGRGRLSRSTLHRLSRFSGSLLMFLAVVVGIRLVLRLAQP